MVQAPENIQSLNRYSYVLNNPLNATDPSGYIWVTLIVAALKFIAASAGVNAALATAIGYLLTAYKYYGYYQLAKGVLAASKGNTASIGKFVGGLVKSYVQGMAQSCATGGDCIFSSEAKAAKQGKGGSDLGANSEGLRSGDEGNRFNDTPANRSELLSDMEAIDSKIAQAGPKRNGVFDTKAAAAKFLDSNSHPLARDYKVELYNGIFEVASKNGEGGFAIGKTVTSFNSESISLEAMKGSVVTGFDFVGKAGRSEWHSHNSATLTGTGFSFADGQPQNGLTTERYMSYSYGKSNGLKRLDLNKMEWNNGEYNSDQIRLNSTCITGDC